MRLGRSLKNACDMKTEKVLGEGKVQMGENVGGGSSKTNYIF